MNIELAHSTDLRLSYVHGMADYPHRWGISGKKVCFDSKPIFGAIFDQREIWELVRRAEGKKN